jgi:Fic family protein
VQNYAKALREGFLAVRKLGGLGSNQIKGLQEILEPNKKGFRKIPGTALKDSLGNTVYTPPQSAIEIEELMTNLERYINEDMDDLDPLIKMTLVHFQFESIHPFYDGNGRTGRIINILYLVLKGLIDIPVLYLSRYIIDHKAEYYELIQNVRDKQELENWIVWMLTGVEETARTTIQMLQSIRSLISQCKKELKEKTNIYSKDLLDILFMHPYTKVSFLTDSLGIHRNTAASYLNTLTDVEILSKVKVGRSNYYVNKNLYALLSEEKN